MVDSNSVIHPLPPGGWLLELAKSWLPVLSVVAGGLWGLYTYLDHQQVARREADTARSALANISRAQAQRDSRVRLIEAQKPFLDKQLALYFETAQVIGRLVTETWPSDHWQADRQRFWQLYWSELTMVEHIEVATAMKAFGDQLALLDGNIQAKQPVDDKAVRRLQDLALNVARALRKGVENSWSSAGDSQALVAPL